MRHTAGLLIGLILLISALVSATTSAAPIGDAAFQRTWERADRPVAEGAAVRSWLWGPTAYSAAVQEPYEQSPGGYRKVQYFDKSRMEITHPGGDQSSQWYVTNGLLARELITGDRQVGDSAFEDGEPANVGVAGDPDDATGPHYATFGMITQQPVRPAGATIIDVLARDGSINSGAHLAAHGVTVGPFEPLTGYSTASVFHAFITAHGTIYQNGDYTTGEVAGVFAVGLPITEAYWAQVKVAGNVRDVLVQCFERRCLTFTPANDSAWQVEMGNVGQHYHVWRYPETEPGPNQQINQLAEAVAGASSDEARYVALLDVMAAVNVGVYTGDGTMVLGGAERGAADFYLYDIELRMMAGAMGRGQTSGVVDLAMQLTAMDVLSESRVVDPELLRQGILAGVAAARVAPHDLSSRSALLVRELGLLQPEPYDLFRDPSLLTMRIDPLSFFLLLSEISVPLVKPELPLAAGASSQLMAQSNGVLKPQSSALCDAIGMAIGDLGKTAYSWGKISAEVFKLIPNAIGKATLVLDGIHGAVLAYSVGVTMLNDGPQRTHMGPAGHTPLAGEPLRFRIKVEMRDALPDGVVSCGWILGTEYPKQGPIEDVSIHWFWETQSPDGQPLHEMVEMQCGSACPVAGASALAIDATGPDGIATIILVPREEPDPGSGWIVEDTGVITGVALYQSRFTNLLGAYAQYLTPKSDGARWWIGRHETPGWQVTMTLSYEITGGIDEATQHYLVAVTFSIHVPATAIELPYRPITGIVAASGGGFLHGTQANQFWARWTWESDWADEMTYGPVRDGPGGVKYLRIDVPVMPHLRVRLTSSGSSPSVSTWQTAPFDYTAIMETYDVPEFALVDGNREVFPLAPATAVCNHPTIVLLPDCSHAGTWTVEVKWVQQPGQ
ncbi:MAG TPA: hypothetical protein VMM78_05865 [Thermomicrobiales bacterium]|nr:hypothetical protein [Thermomicrobiales bacterium]